MLKIQPGLPPDCGRVVWQLSELSRLDRKEALVAAAVEAVCSRNWVSALDQHWLLLCLDEVVVNAMLHGNEGDPGLPIHLTLCDAGQDWVLRVDDQGTGFSPESVPDPDAPDSLLLEHGRGILIMREWLDALEYWRGGACAVLRRHKER